MVWELDHKEGWAPKKWCFQIVVLKKTLKNPLDSNEIKLGNSKGNQPWIFIGKTDAKAEAPILRPPDTKSWLIGKDPDAGRDWGQEEKGDGDEQGGLACCNSWVRKELDTTDHNSYSMLYEFYRYISISISVWTRRFFVLNEFILNYPLNT